MRRLFLFAGYDSGGLAGPSLVYYCARLREAGDVVIRFDNDCNQEELDRLRPFVLHAEAGRHGEYDFGSYKRAMDWALKNLEVGVYDWIEWRILARTSLALCTPLTGGIPICSPGS